MARDKQSEKKHSRLFTASAILFAFFVAFVCIISSYVSRFDSELKHENQIHLAESSHYIATYMTRVVTDTQSSLRTVADSLIIMDSEKEKMDYLRGIMDQYDFAYVGYANTDGLLHATLESQSVSVLNEDYFVEALDGKNFVSKYIRKIFKNSASSGILLSVPIYDNQGTPSGMLVAMMEIAQLSETLSLDSFDGDGYSYIFDKEGTIVMRTKSLDINNLFAAWKLVDFEGDYTFNKAYYEIMSDKEGLTCYTYLGGKKYAYYKPLPFNNWSLVNIVSEQVVSARTDSLIAELIAIGAIAVIVVLGLMFLAMRSYGASQNSKQATSAKSAFLANMSHEIRTPMNAIVGMSEILLRGELSGKQREQVLNILNSGKGLLTIINDILDISKIESGKFTISDEQYELESILYDITVITAIRMGEKPVEFLVELDPTLPRCLVGDMGRLKQILINIIGNAIKFTNHGSIKLIVSGVKEHGGWVLSFEVRDTGIGIKSEDLNKLFGNFNQVDTLRNKNIEGTGLGLSISQKLAEMMGGSITVKSEYEVGSSFFITVKQGYVSGEPVSSPITQHTSILMCEPSDILREYEADCMSKLNLTFEMCHTASEFDAKMRNGIYTHAVAHRSVLNRLSSDCFGDTHLIALFGLNEHSLIDSGISNLYVPLLPLQLPYAIEGACEGTHTQKHALVDSDIIEPLPNISILIVDDNLVNIEVAIGLMEPYGMHITQALSGEQAIHSVQAKNYDLVLMDHMMPGMSGVEATKEIRALDGEKYKNLPIVALTANAGNEARQMFLREGFDDFLSKPIETKKLHIILRKYLKKLNSERQNGDNPVNSTNSTHREPVKEPRILNGAEVNFTDGLEQIGSTATYCKILNTYLTVGREKLTQLSSWFADDLERFIIEIHALKSSSASIGALGLSSLAADMEKLGVGHGDKIAPLLPHFMSRFESALGEIEGFLATATPTTAVHTKHVLPSTLYSTRKKHIVVVDDDAVNLDLAESVLENDYIVTKLTSGEDLLVFLELSMPDMILLDIRMPNMDGYETFKATQRRTEWRNIPVIFLTGQNDVQSEREGLRLGAKDFIIKPFDNVVMLSRVRSQMELSQYQTELEDIIDNKTKEVEELQHVITVGWAEIIESRDGTTGSHVRNTTSYFQALLDVLYKIPTYNKILLRDDKSDLLRASSLHDIGKIGISDLVLKKPSKLTADEFSYMQRHSKIGSEMIQKIIDSTRADNFLLYAHDMALYHHERWDGTGYPCCLKGNEIPLYVQVLTMADVFEALTAVRPYKRAFTFEESLEIMYADRGTFYNPDLFDIFFANKDVFKQALDLKQKEIIKD